MYLQILLPLGNICSKMACKGTLRRHGYNSAPFHLEDDWMRDVFAHLPVQHHLPALLYLREKWRENHRGHVVFEISCPH
jgi:hypothetical protein